MEYMMLETPWNYRGTLNCIAFNRIAGQCGWFFATSYPHSCLIFVDHSHEKIIGDLDI